MIDYHGGCVALNEFTSTLAAATFPDVAVADAQHAHLAAVAAEGGPALLGVLVQHLLGHAASDGAELALLQRAADLWSRGAALCAELGVIRADLEQALENPGNLGSADRFNAAAVNAQTFANTANAMRVEVDAFRTDALTFAHLPPHPRQQDRQTDTWDWGNLVLARRSDAFVRTLFRSTDNPRSTAFAVGAVASYGANVVGSAYIGRAVGGPRRSHRYRNRTARNAVGSWLAAHRPTAMSPTAMAHQITFGSPASPTLPNELETLIRDALGQTFDLGRTMPLPDLQLGYRRLVQHLTLLDGFARPPVPTTPGQVWMATLYADPNAPPPTLRPQDFDVTGQDGGGVAVQHGPSAPGSSTPDNSDSNKVAKGCGIAVAIIILIDLLQAFVQCIGQWANGHTCTFWENMLLEKVWEKDPPSPQDATRPENPNVTAAQLTSIAASPQAAQLVGMLFDVHAQVWEAMDRAYAFLAVAGLIYPGDLATMPVYAQFTSLPGNQPWPRREEPDPADTYHLYPSTPLESPAADASPFPAGANPGISMGQFQGPNATEIALQLWRQVAAGDFDSQNRDLDADRGFAHPCWTASGSVHDDPIDVVILGYNDQ